MERKYEQIIFDKTNKHQKEIDVSNSSMWEQLLFFVIQSLFARFQDSAQIEENLRKSKEVLKVGGTS